MFLFSQTFWSQVRWLVEAGVPVSLTLTLRAEKHAYNS